MKNVIIPFILVLVSVITYGQQIPNPEFNSWVSHGSYEEPESWSTSNEALSILNESTVFKSSDAYSGSYSAMLETKFLLGFTNVPGLITLAEISIDLLSQTYSISGGLPLKENVAKLTGMYKYAGIDNDSATVLIYNFKRDENGDIDTIGFGTTYLHDATTWSPFTVNMVNQNSHVPDTFNVVIISSGEEFHNGSVLKIDSLAIETNTGIIYLDNNKTIVNVFPNPAVNNVTFDAKSSGKNRTVNIYNLTGTLIDILNFNDAILTYSVIGLTSGTYMYSIIENNKPVSSGSFIKR